MHPLDGVNLKLNRASHHRVHIENFIQGFRESDPYAVGEKFNANAGQKVWYVDGDPVQPSLTVSPIIGDFLYDLRSALDNLAWELVIANKQGPTRRTAFPLFDDPNSWKANKRSCLKGMSKKARTMIRDLQPCFGPNPNRNDVLSWLEDLCNTDKHRHLNLVAASQEGGFFTKELPIGSYPTYAAGGPVENGTELAWLDGLTQDDPDMHFRPMVDVAFGDESAAPLESVALTIAKMYEVVTQTIAAFRSEFF